jgi:hypothetical protein
LSLFFYEKGIVLCEVVQQRTSQVPTLFLNKPLLQASLLFMLSNYSHNMHSRNSGILTASTSLNVCGLIGEAPLVAKQKTKGGIKHEKYFNKPQTRSAAFPST